MSCLNGFLLSCKTALRFHQFQARNGFSNRKLIDLLTAMPKEMTHTISLRSQRVKLKEKSQKYSPGTVNLQVIGSGAKGAPRSLYLFTDQSRYLFNCGEGTQRLAHEHKMKLSKLEHIFITHSCWENIGGLPGVALTIQDVGVPEITLHGPKGIDKIFSATKHFVVLRNLSIKTADYRFQKKFEDNAIIVKYIPLCVEAKDKPKVSSPKKSPKSEGSADDTDYYSHERKSPPNPFFKTVKKRSSSLDSSGSESEEGKHSWTMCFAVKLQPRPGTLSLEKCVKAGVPPGPLLGMLKSGKDVVLDDGTVVRSSDVTQASQPSPVFLVVDCPNHDFLAPLENETAFHRYQMDGLVDSDNIPQIIVHFSPPEIMAHPIYHKWMSKFSISTQHLILNDSNTCMGSIAVHRVQHKLNLLEPSIFPLLNDITYQESKSLNGNSKISSISGKMSEFSIINASTFSTVNLRPKTYFDESIRLKVNPEEYKKEVMDVDGFGEELKKLKSGLSIFSDQVESDYPNVIFLGTGSCIPNKIRNTSAILLNLSKDSCILLDCGEGTYGQLVRYFGTDEVMNVLNRLKAIYISHLHADHHIGLIGILKALVKYNPKKCISLLAPKQIMPWLHVYDKHFEPILSSIELVANTNMLYNNYKLSKETQKHFEKDLGLQKIETTFVVHCPNAFGVSFTHQNGWKLTYSGDTMPCDSLVELGQGSDLLIHEATMEDELGNEALIKLHSTTSQAIDIGKRMKAKFTILTHFSQRYAKLPRLGESENLGENVGIAFDNMKISFTDLPKLHSLYPALKLMFQEDCEELEQKALKRQLKQERENRKKAKLSKESVATTNFVTII